MKIKFAYSENTAKSLGLDKQVYEVEINCEQWPTEMWETLEFLLDGDTVVLDMRPEEKLLFEYIKFKLMNDEYKTAKYFNWVP